MRIDISLVSSTLYRLSGSEVGASKKFRYLRIFRLHKRAADPGMPPWRSTRVAIDQRWTSEGPS